jgi:hypothetical protein
MVRECKYFPTFLRCREQIKPRFLRFALVARGVGHNPSTLVLGRWRRANVLGINIIPKCVSVGGAAFGLSRMSRALLRLILVFREINSETVVLLKSPHQIKPCQHP